VVFANTAGGTLIVGVRDKTKEIIGLPDPLKDEERLSNTFADGIRPLMIPDIQFSSFRDRSLIIVSVPHSIGPYYVRSQGPEKGVSRHRGLFLAESMAHARVLQCLDRGNIKSPTACWRFRW
jgi:predicted HTH transcriptional regulator